MPAQPPERDTIRRNFGLITSWQNFLTFVAAPVLAYVWFTYTIFHLGEDSLIPAKARIMLAIVYLVLAFATMYLQAETIREQPKQKGYEQRRSSTREIDFVFNLAILAACFFWLQRLGDDPDAFEESDYWLWVVILVWGAFLWSFFLMVSNGPVLWFTVRVR